ncbi:MAG: hypothetical protein ACT4QC_08525 [Planctomycetaceae bacterium]
MNADASVLTPGQGEVAGESAQAELCGFAAALLEQCGGVVEWADPAACGTALLPAPVARLLRVDETVALAARQEPGTLCVSLASEFLDQAQAVLEDLVARVGSFQVPDHYLKKGDLQGAIDNAFTWHNARVRVRGSEPACVAYHSWWFLASLKSEDIFETRLNITINAASQAPVDLPDFLDLPDLEPCREPLAAAPQDTFDRAVGVCQTRLVCTAAGFIARMESRAERDRKRLRDYYQALRREAGSTKRRAAAPPNEEELASRRRAVNLELERKLAELDERYQIEASLEPIALACLRSNVLAVELLVQRKLAERTVHVYWNPLTKRLEPLGCTQCGQGTYSVAFTDEEVAALCAECHRSRTTSSRSAARVLALPRR